MMLSNSFSYEEKLKLAKGDSEMKQVMTDVEDYFTKAANYLAYVQREMAQQDEFDKQFYYANELKRHEAKAKADKEKAVADTKKESNKNVALKMLKAGCHLDLIVQISSLTKDKIKKIAIDNGLVVVQ